MLVSKIKPCMSKYKQLYRETANGSLNRSSIGVGTVADRGSVGRQVLKTFTDKG